MQFVRVDNESHQTVEMIANNRLLVGRKDNRVCGLTKQLIEAGENVTLISNNNFHFPDKLVLTKAFNDIGQEESIRRLKKSYKEYQELRQKINKKYFEWELE